MTSPSSNGKIATSCYSLLSFFGYTSVRILSSLGFSTRCCGWRTRPTAQDAVTIGSTMWHMLSSIFQQQQCQVCPAFAPGTPQIRGTPVGNPSFIATPRRFPALAPVQIQQVDCTLTPTTVAQLVMTSNAGQQDNGSYSSWQHGGVEP